MSLLHSGQATQITKYSGLQVQTTSSAVPIPICYGANTQTPNAIWYANFKATPAGGKGSGKGGALSGGGGATTYNYSCSIVMGVCEGPISGIGKVWQTAITPISLASLGLGLADGTTPQTTWSYLASNFPTQALSYPGTAYVFDSTFSLGQSASVGDNTFEVLGILHGTGFNGIDADPARIILDFLTNAQYGVGFPASSIDMTALLGGTGTSSYQAYCWSVGIAMSPSLSGQETGASVLARWLQLTNSTAVWSGGKLKIIPYGDAATTGNGQSWVPDLTPLYDLTDDDFVGTNSDDPVQIMRSDPYAAHNRQSIEIQARSDSYNTGPIVAFDQSSIDRFGLRIGSSVTAHEICDLGIAQTVAQLILQRGLYIRNTYHFKLSWEYGLLDPMDLVTLTDPVLGLVNTVVRIIDIEEADDGLLTITAEEFPQGVATSVLYPVQAKSNGAPDSNVAAAPVNPPLLIEPPPALTANSAQLWIGVSGQGGDPNWGGCFVWVSADDISYSNIAKITAPAQQGVLSAALARFSGSNPDTIDALSVDLSESGGTLRSTTAASAASAFTLSYVNGEYLSFTDATLTALNRYGLNNLYRGLYGSVPAEAPSGSPFCLLDSAILRYNLPAGEIGQTIYLKFQSFNIFGSGLEDISTCTAYAYVVNGSGTLGPVASALAIGTAMDFGSTAADPVAESDDYGFVTTDAVTHVIDLGSISA